MKWFKSESGLLIAACEKCGGYYEMGNEWDMANLDWHLCQKVGS